MSNPRVALVSLGCDKNLSDSEHILGRLRAAGFVMTDDRAKADAILVNTCGFIQSAAEESAAMLRECADYKQTGRCKAVVALGCMARRYQHQLAEKLPWADATVGFEDYAHIARILYDLLGETAAEPARPAARFVSTGHYAYLKIAEGCDNRCAYCAIPAIRGGYVSRPKEELLAEATAMAAGGVKELILVAQDTALYGTDLYGKPVLPELLAELADIDGVKALRLMYCYPEHITDGLVAEMARNPKVCRYIDMPVQHAADAVLKAMGRRGTLAGLRAIIAKLRAAMPDITIRTTLMVGFPGETEDDFRALEAFVNEIKFGRLGVLAYSREEGTAAFDLPNQIPENVKNRRRARLMEAQRKISRKKQKAYIGQTLAARVDGPRENGYAARGAMDAPEVDGLIYVSGGGLKPGDDIRVKITGADDYDLTGVLIDG